MAGRGLYAVRGICPASRTDGCGVEDRYAQQAKEYRGAEERSAALVGFVQQSVLFRQRHNAERIFGSPVTRGQHVGPHEYLDIDSRSAADVRRSLRSRPLRAAP